ncbi:MAG: cytoplasmic protein [Dehalococcoidia bacterium]
MAGDAVSVAPDLYKVLFENDRVRVLETRYGPGIKSDMHSHPDLVAVAVTPLKAKLTLADGQSLDMDLQSGEAVFVDGQEHTVENTSTSELQVILVELK